MMTVTYAPKLTSEKTIMPASPSAIFEREEIRTGTERGDIDQPIGDRLGRSPYTINA